MTVDAGKAPTTGFSFQNSFAAGSSVPIPAVIEKKPLPDLGSNVFGSKKTENKENTSSIFSMAGLGSLGSENKFLGSSTDASKSTFSFASGASTGFSFGGTDKSLSFASLTPVAPIIPLENQEPKITISAKTPEVEKPGTIFGKPAEPPTSNISSFSVLNLSTSSVEKPKTSIFSGFTLPTTTSISPIEIVDQAKSPKVNVKGEQKLDNLGGDTNENWDDEIKIEEAPKTSIFGSSGVSSTSVSNSATSSS